MLHRKAYWEYHDLAFGFHREEAARLHSDRVVDIDQPEGRGPTKELDVPIEFWSSMIRTDEGKAAKGATTVEKGVPMRAVSDSKMGRPTAVRTQQWQLLQQLWPAQADPGWTPESLEEANLRRR